MNPLGDAGELLSVEERGEYGGKRDHFAGHVIANSPDKDKASENSQDGTNEKLAAPAEFTHKLILPSSPSQTEEARTGHSQLLKDNYGDRPSLVFRISRRLRNLPDHTGLLQLTTSLSRWGPIQPIIAASPTSREVGFCRQCLSTQLAIVRRLARVVGQRELAG